MRVLSIHLESLTTRSRGFSFTSTIKELIPLQITQLQGLSALSQIVQAYGPGLCCDLWASRAKIVAKGSPQVPHVKFATGWGAVACTFSDCVIKTSLPSRSGVNSCADETPRTAFTSGCSMGAGFAAWTYGCENRCENADGGGPCFTF
jgi:hypothetical protein